MVPDGWLRTPRSTMNSGKRQVVLSFILVIPFVLISALVAQEKTPAPHASTHSTEARLVLHEGWSLQTSAKVEAKPEVISTPQFAAKGWMAVTVPTTVVAAQVKDKAFHNPYFGMHLRSLPGVNCANGGNLSNVTMAFDSP